MLFGFASVFAVSSFSGFSALADGAENPEDNRVRFREIECSLSVTDSTTSELVELNSVSFRKREIFVNRFFFANLIEEPEVFTVFFQSLNDGGNASVLSVNVVAPEGSLLAGAIGQLQRGQRANPEFPLIRVDKKFSEPTSVGGVTASALTGECYAVPFVDGDSEQ